MPLLNIKQKLLAVEDIFYRNMTNIQKEEFVFEEDQIWDSYTAIKEC